MQDDGMSEASDAAHRDSDDSHRPEAEDMSEREALLNERRSKQLGRVSRGKRMKVLALAFGGGALFLLLTIAGPKGALKMFGFITSDKAETSTIDMEVAREKNAQTRLDFTVPAPPEPTVEKPVDPNAAWSARFKELQDKMEEMEKNRKPDISSSEIRDMLSEHNNAITRKLEAERKAMAAENARLKEIAERAERERERLEAEAQMQAANAKDRAKIEKMQRESESVLVDERDRFAEGTGHASQEGGGTEDLDQNERFLKSSAASVVQTSVSQRLYDTSRMIVQGTIISAVLETAIDTQLPGNIRAQVMRPVYSFDGKRVLMPPGTMLIGQFNNDVELAQKRVLIAWNRAVTPDGKSIAIGSTGTDTLGRAGTLGNVDNRYGTKFGSAVLISAISAIPTALSSKAGGGSGRSSGSTINIGSQFAGGAGDSLAEQSSGVLEKYLSLPQVIRIPQGEEVRVFVNRDLLFK